MFGLGKSAPKSSATTKTKTKSSASLPWKQWMLNHIEKVGMAFFLLLTSYFVYDGLTAKSYENPKTPSDLQNDLRLVKTKIETEDHNPQIFEEPQRKTPPDFVKKVEDARKDMDPTPYATSNIPATKRSQSGEKRGDPELFAPLDIHVAPFYGVIAINSPTASKADALLNAPPVGDGKKARRPPTIANPAPARTMSQVFDFGYQHKPGAAPVPAVAPSPIPGRPPVRPVEMKVVAAIKMFNIITAAVPHEMMADSYRKAFASATGYSPARDSPNYMDYEVQRVDVTSDPERKIGEAEWQEAKGCMTEAQLKERKGWAGVCEEVSLPNYLVPDVLTMPIPPILISDYRKLASHPLVPTNDVERTFSAGGDTERSSTMNETVEASGNSDTSLEGGVGQPNPTAVEEDPKNIPKAIEESTYKLLRFVDVNVENGKTYRYRVRLALEDPNYTRSKAYTPKTQDLMPETVVRVQAKEAADNDAMSKLPQGAKFVRNSKMHTPWSESSPAVGMRRPVELYTSQTIRNVNDSMPPKATIVYAEWYTEYAMLIPLRMEAVRGTLLSGTPTALFAAIPEVGLDAIEPISKTIKWIPVASPATPKGFRFNTPVSIVDVRGGLPLAAEKGREREKDRLPSGGEVVAFDVDAGLVISREFESITSYQMLGFTNESPTTP